VFWLLWGWFWNFFFDCELEVGGGGGLIFGRDLIENGAFFEFLEK
jgi:hypothetical protein